MAHLRLFAQAKDAAGAARVDASGTTVGQVLDDAVDRYGPGLAEVIAISAIWLNGEPTVRSSPVGADDEVAVLPPVSGG